MCKNNEILYPTNQVHSVGTKTLHSQTRSVAVDYISRATPVSPLLSLRIRENKIHNYNITEQVAPQAFWVGRRPIHFTHTSEENVNKIINLCFEVSSFK